MELSESEQNARQLGLHRAVGCLSCSEPQHARTALRRSLTGRRTCKALALCAVCCLDRLEADAHAAVAHALALVSIRAHQHCRGRAGQAHQGWSAGGLPTCVLHLSCTLCSAGSAPACTALHRRPPKPRAHPCPAAPAGSWVHPPLPRRPLQSNNRGGEQSRRASAARGGTAQQAVQAPLAHSRMRSPRPQLVPVHSSKVRTQGERGPAGAGPAQLSRWATG